MNKQVVVAVDSEQDAAALRNVGLKPILVPKIVADVLTDEERAELALRGRRLATLSEQGAPDKLLTLEAGSISQVISNWSRRRKARKVKIPLEGALSEEQRRLIAERSKELKSKKEVSSEQT